VIVFDRVREELKLNPHLKLMQVLDLAVNRTLSRTTLTSLTTFLASTSLFVFGAGVVSDFALVFMIGIVTGTLSSIFIANPVFFWWHKGDAGTWRRTSSRQNTTGSVNPSLAVTARSPDWNGFYCDALDLRTPAPSVAATLAEALGVSPLLRDCWRGAALPMRCGGIISAAQTGGLGRPVPAWRRGSGGANAG